MATLTNSVLTSAVALVVLAGCSAGGGDTPNDSPAALEHVHGLGIDPEDGTLFAGTHHGLFRVTRTSIEGPVADLEQDFMGFTVAGPRHFLASGHPGPGQSGPGALGLLESTDRGKTWKTRSLVGEADCHALAYGHGTAYCMNSVTGELLASSDLEKWDVRSTEPVFDIAVSPAGPESLNVTTQQGVKTSRDGGRTFGPLAEAPDLVFIDWLGDGTLVGVGPNGQVFSRAPGQRKFVKVGTLGAQPEAFHAVDAKTLYAATGGKIWSSPNGGHTFAVFGANAE